MRNAITSSIVFICNCTRPVVDLFEPVEKAARVAQHLMQGAQSRVDVSNDFREMPAGLIGNVAGKPTVFVNPNR
jgi:hypothetical protein